MGYTVGLDVGGTNIVCGVLDETGRLVGTLKRTTEAEKGFDHVIGHIASMILELLAELGIDKSRVAAVGAGIPGFVDPQRGVVKMAGNLKWINAPVAAALSRQLGLPVYIDNDVRMYVFGEAAFGAGRGFDVVLGVTVGTGLAAAVVDRGNLYYGGGYMAGELGHIRMDGVEYECGCGMSGCLETVASANGIARLARDRAASGESPILAEWFGPDRYGQITAADVSRAYDAGDPIAIDVMNYAGKLLGRGLSYAATLYSPDVIVIGGGGAQAGERLLAPVREELKRLVHPMYWERLTVRTAQLSDHAGVAGSAMHAAKRIAAEAGS